MMKIKTVMAWAFLSLAAAAAAGSPAWTMADYIDLKTQGGQGEEKITTYLIAVIDAIGMTNEAVKAEKQPPIFCQGQRTITIDMIRAILDQWIEENEPTKTPADWRAFVKKQNLAGAVLYSMKGAQCLAVSWVGQSSFRYRLRPKVPLPSQILRLARK
jgi:hypothetical protein